ncbi:MAG: hypothetical protein K6D96_08860 [Acetatifactor sp.]|nr:hypothetical protein [Acetatifactor sp.]
MRRVLTTVLSILAAALIIFLIIALIRKVTVKSVAEQAVDYFSEHVIKEIGGEFKNEGLIDGDAWEILSEEDRETIEDIIDDKINLEIIKNGVEMIKAKDYKALENYAKDIFSDSEVDTLKEILEKYEDQLKENYEKNF